MEDRIWHQHYDYNVQTSYRFPRCWMPSLWGYPTNTAVKP